MSNLRKSVFDLMNRQRAKIEALQMDKEQLESDVINANMNCEHLQAELAKLTEEINRTFFLINYDDISAEEAREILKMQKLIIIPDNEGAVIRIDEASIKAEAVKEFAKILKARIIFNFVRTKRIIKIIDKVVEELVGETDV